MIDDELGAKFQANFCKILKFEKSGDFNGGYETFQEMEIFKSMFVKVIRHCGLIQHHFFFSPRLESGLSSPSQNLY